MLLVMKEKTKLEGWISLLSAEITRTVKSLRADGVTAMSEDNLRQIVRTPSGGPVGTNAAYFYKNDWFPAALKEAHVGRFVMTQSHPASDPANLLPAVVAAMGGLAQ
jgi:hypothetical protein